MHLKIHFKTFSYNWVFCQLITSSRNRQRSQSRTTTTTTAACPNPTWWWCPANRATPDPRRTRLPGDRWRHTRGTPRSGRNRKGSTGGSGSSSLATEVMWVWVEKKTLQTSFDCRLFFYNLFLNVIQVQFYILVCILLFWYFGTVSSYIISYQLIKTVYNYLFFA